MTSHLEIFHVVIHDVTPQFVPEISSILAGICQLVGNQVAAGVVPRWHHEERREDGGAYRALITERFGEVLLHGCTHRQERASGLISALTGKANEFGGISITDAIARVLEGQDVLGNLVGAPVRGFIPPAWDRGPLTARLLQACGLEFYVGMMGIEHVDGTTVPLSTWSWDSGAIAQLGNIGDLFGHVAFALRPQSVPCVTFHPADVERGFLARGIRLIERLLEKGRKPVLFQDVARRHVLPIAA